MKKLTQLILLGSIMTIHQTALSQETAAQKSQEVKKMTVEPGSLTAMIKDSVTFSILTKALRAAELDVTLGNKGEFTIFAPTDEAFGKLPTGVLAKLLLPENKEKLRSLLLYHVVAGKVLATDLKDGDVKTMNGEKVKVNVQSEKIEIDGAKVFSADVMANNGVMHTIGVVMIPKSLDDIAGLDP
jgi:uncharacterized surface protein with fasciclin (FAS1) repeats